MATQNLSSTPTALASTTTGTTYTIQAQVSSKMYVQVGSSAPTSNDGAFVIGANSFATTKHDSGEGIYVWQDEAPAYGRVVYDESA